MSKARQQANLSSDGNLFADISNDRVGVGSVAPTHKLHVNGTSKFDDDVKFEGTTAAKNIIWDKSADALKVSDDGKITFGGSADLSLYHDSASNNSYIKEGGSGNLYIFSENLRIENADGSDSYIEANNGGAVELFWDGGKKLETTNTGAKVTGNLEVTGVLTYDDVTSVDSVGIVTARAGVHIDDSIVHIGDTNTKIRFPAGDEIQFETGGSTRLHIGSGNITQTIDTDGEGLIITAGDMKPMLTGNSNRSAHNNTIFGISGKWNNTEVGRIAFEAGADTTNKDDGKINLYTRVSGGSLTSRLHIDSNGYVGIKLTDPSAYYAKDLVVKSIDQGGITIRSSGTSDTQYLMFADGTSGNERYRGYVGYQHNTGSGGGEHVQIAAGGGGGGGLMRYYGDGRLGLGVTPKSWHSNNKSVIQGLGGYSILGRSNNLLGIYQNFYYDASDAGKYMETGEATAYFQNDGTHKFYTAVSGSADASCSLQERLKINHDGTFYINGDATGGRIYATNGNLYLQDGNGRQTFRVDTMASGTRTSLLTGGGCLSIGTASPTQPNVPGIHIESDEADDCRIAFVTTDKANTRIGYYGLSNRFGVDMHNGFQIRDAGQSYATRLLIDYYGAVWTGGTTQYGNSAFNISNGGIVATSSGENTLKLIDSTAQAQDVGARILLGGNYRSSGDASPFVELKSYKENGTDNNYDYGFIIGTTKNGGSLSNSLVVKSSGDTDIYGSQVHLYNNANTSNTYFVAQNTAAGNAGIRMKNNQGDFAIIANDNLRFYDIENSTEHMTITPTSRIGIGNNSPEAALHPRANTNTGTDTAFMVGTGNRFFKLLELSGQDNFGQCYMQFYDNSLREILTLENSYAGLVSMGMEIAFRGHGGGKTGDIRVYNTAVNSTQSKMDMSASGGTGIEIDHNGHVGKPNTPSFAAYRAQSGWTVGTHTEMVFNATRHNIGSHYSTSTGRFTAPRAGSYLFTFFTIHNTNVTSAYLRMYINGARQNGSDIHFSYDMSGHWDNVAYSQIFYLSKDDYVSIYNGGSSVQYHGNNWQQFCGYLLG